MLIIGFMYCSD